jgi:hypothetical protein
MLLDRQRFAGDHRPVDGARTLGDLPVDRDLFAGADNDRVADDDFLDRQVDLVAVAKDAGRLGLQPDQLLDRLGGAPLRLDFQRKAENDQRRDDVGDVPEDFGERGSGEKSRGRDRDHRVEKGGGDPDRDQGVHVGRTVLQGGPHAGEEL